MRINCLRIFAVLSILFTSACDQADTPAGGAAVELAAPLPAAVQQGDGFADNAQCLQCHQQQAEAWAGSHHDLAMAVANADSVLGDFNAAESTLFIRATKFYKERIIPLSISADAELRGYLNLRRHHGLPIEKSSPLIWNRIGSAEGRAYTSTGLVQNWRLLCASLKILTPKGIPPRIHDIRHSFAVNALMRWYNNSENVMAKLPQLSTYMGHVSVVSTQYYLPFAESLRSEANARFEKKYGTLIQLLSRVLQPEVYDE